MPPLSEPTHQRILVTGGNGLLGQSLMYVAQGRHTMLSTGRGPQRGESFGAFYQTVDCTDPAAIDAAILDFNPDVVIHAAAMTQVDQCTLEPERCQQLNVEATANVVRACETHQKHLIFISTDFIFDGENGPYCEEDAPAPLSVYGQSKLDAEALVKAAQCPWTIARTVLVIGYVPGLSRSNIILWARQALGKGETIRVVDDQVRSPTWSIDLAEGCLRIAERTALGVYHLSGPETMSILELVERVADHGKLDKSLIQRVSSVELGQPAKRPPITGFVIDKARQDLDFEPHSFDQVLDAIPYI